MAIVTEPLLEEMVSVLARPWLQQSYGLGDDDVRDFLRLLALRSDLVVPTAEIHRCRDPHDDKFLEAAVEGRADRLVTGDADLMALGTVGDVSIVMPAEFVAELQR